jgi:hypothetical protein
MNISQKDKPEGGEEIFHQALTGITLFQPVNIAKEIKEGKSFTFNQ